MWLTTAEAMEKYSVSAVTLRTWDKDGKVQTKRTAGKQRRYWDSLGAIEKEEGDEDIERPKVTILYGRVSTRGQSDNLTRQVSELEQYARKRGIENFITITDIGSGINFKRSGLKTILDRRDNETLKEVVVTHKDRLARIAFDLIERMLYTKNIPITIINNTNYVSKDEELTEDLITILHVYSAKSSGGRRYGKKEKDISIVQDQVGSDSEAEKDNEDVDRSLSDNI